MLQSDGSLEHMKAGERTPLPRERATPYTCRVQACTNSAFRCAPTQKFLLFSFNCLSHVNIAVAVRRNQRDDTQAEHEIAVDHHFDRVPECCPYLSHVDTAVAVRRIQRDGTQAEHEIPVIIV